MQLALEIAIENLTHDKQYIGKLKTYFIDELKRLDADISFNGCSSTIESSSYLILSARFPKDFPMFLFSLDLKGVAASGGSACQSGSNQGSHVLNTILQPDEAEKTSVRFSFSKFTTKEELDYTIQVIKELI